MKNKTNKPNIPKTIQSVNNGSSSVPEIVPEIDNKIHTQLSIWGALETSLKAYFSSETNKDTVEPHLGN